MKIPDVNVWLAAAWARHSKHSAAKSWIDAEPGDLAFCRITQMSLLRLLTNPAITKDDALPRRQAWDVYEKFIADPRIRLIAEPQGLETLWAAFSKRDDKSHLLWTDDYMAAFAQASDAEFVTFDRALSKRYASVRIICLQ
ncbi:MAG: PIN domain-containing protein [Acidobacteria bacterium]|nr:PIN domain-containing protein [Acidobacteriota bacterium]